MKDFGSSPGRILELLQDNGYKVLELKGFRRDRSDLVAFDPSLARENTMIWATRSTVNSGELSSWS
jgi:hypothetical protein